MLRRVHIMNYRCFGDFELLPEDLSLLLGRNGTGKSTLLDVLWGLREIVVDGRAFNDAVLFESSSTGAVTVELDLELAAGDVRYRLVVGPSLEAASDLVALEEVVTDLSGGGELFAFRDGLATWTDGEAWRSPHRRDVSALSAIPFQKSPALVELKQWFEGVWMLRLAPQSMEASADEADPELTVYGENFISWLLSFEEVASLSELGPELPSPLLARVSPHLRPVLDGFEGLAWVLAGRDVVLAARFSYQERGLIDFRDLSDGQRCLIVLYSVLELVSDLSLLLLDEPDSHVTSTELAPLFRTLRQRTDAGELQAIVASHHPQVIDLLASEDPWELVDTPDGVVARPFEVPRAKGLSASRHLLLRGRQGA